MFILHTGKIKAALIEACLTTAQSNVGLQSYKLFVGTPLSNCHNGTAPIDSEISGSISTSDTWSPGLSIGLQFGPLNLQTSDGWSHSTIRMYSQSVTIHVPPAQQISYSMPKLATDFLTYINYLFRVL